MRKLPLLAAFLLSCVLLGSSTGQFAAMFDFLSDPPSESKEYTLLSPPSAAIEPLQTETEQPGDCTAINQDNPYLEAAKVEGDTEDSWHYDVELAVEEFLETQDAHFADRIATFSASAQGNGCDLSDPETEESSLMDHDIDPPEQFAIERLPELRQIDCAFEHILRSEKLLCGSGIVPMAESYACDREYREWKLEHTRNQLVIAMESALIQMDEMAIAWPLHKRLECLNEKFADQREKVIDFLKVYSKLPRAFHNAAQSK